MTTQNFEKPKKYDTENAVFCLWVAYKYPWAYNGGTRSNITYFFKYTNDKDYTGNGTELNRIMNLISERLTIEYMDNENPMATIILYRNSNCGRTLSGVNNKEIFKIRLTDGFIINEPIINPQDMSRVELSTWQGILKSLTDFSRENKRALQIHEKP